MTTRFLIALIVMGLLLVPSRLASGAPSEWGEEVAPGIEYRRFQLTDPHNNVFVARMDRNNPALTIESSLSKGNIAGDTETVSDMAQRYDGAINYWDRIWGNTNEVVVAINGSFFCPDPTYEGCDEEPPGFPWGGQVQSGWYIKRFWQQRNSSDSRIHRGFTWKLSREAFITECITHPEDKQTIDYIRGGEEFAVQYFDSINEPSQDNQVVVYTPQYDSKTPAYSVDTIEVFVEISRPTLIVTQNERTYGRIVDIRVSSGLTPIPFDHIVLSLQGAAKSEFLDFGVNVGDEIGISQRVKNCDTTLPYDFYNAYASVMGDFIFLKDGIVYGYKDNINATTHNPRTAVAFNDQYIFFIVVDGRDLVNSIGMTIEELGIFSRDVLGAQWGISQDGGGSSTMVINGEVVNNTYCNINSCKQAIYYLPIVSRSGDLTKSAIAPGKEEVSPLPVDQPEILSADGLPLTSQYYVYSQDVTGPTLQRLVANGLMMVVVQPRDLSLSFQPDDQIKAVTNAEVYLGPGSNYAVVGTANAGTQGTILDHTSGLNGVLAKGHYWWKVKFGSLIGWIIEESISPVSPLKVCLGFDCLSE